MENMVPSCLKMCASSSYFSGNRWLRNIKALTPLFSDIHGPWLHEGTSKVRIYSKDWLIKYKPNGTTLKKEFKKIILNMFASQLCKKKLVNFLIKFKLTGFVARRTKEKWNENVSRNVFFVKIWLTKLKI